MGVITNQQPEIQRVGRFTVRIPTIADIDKLLYVENRAWAEDQAFKREHFESQITTFPEGLRLVEYQGHPVANGVTEILNYDLKCPIATWEQATDNGFIRNHNPFGDTLYGVSLSVVPRSEWRVGPLLVAMAKKATVEMGLKRLVLGSRIPRFHRFSGTIEEYLDLENDGKKCRDPELRFYMRNGFRIVCPLPGYFPDAESRDYGVLIAWDT